MLTLKKKKKSPYVLNPNSHRYRICPSPFCGKEHMVSNIGRQYCSDKCADEHYRHKIKDGVAPAMPRTRAGPFGDDRWPPGMVRLPVFTPIGPDEYQAQVKKNVEFLDAHRIDPIDGTEFEKSYLLQEGFNIHYHSGNPKALNISEKYGCKYLLFEKYMLINISNNKVVIGLTK